jgi:hypothetical protein
MKTFFAIICVWPLLSVAVAFAITHRSRVVTRARDEWVASHPDMSLDRRIAQ